MFSYASAEAAGEAGVATAVVDVDADPVCSAALAPFPLSLTGGELMSSPSVVVVLETEQQREHRNNKPQKGKQKNE